MKLQRFGQFAAVLFMGAVLGAILIHVTSAPVFSMEAGAAPSEVQQEPKGKIVAIDDMNDWTITGNEIGGFLVINKKTAEVWTYESLVDRNNSKLFRAHFFGKLQPGKPLVER